MANEWKPQIWSTALLANFAKATTALGISNLDYQGDFAGGATSVRILVPAGGTATVYNPANAPISWADVGEGYVDLALNKQYYVAMKVDDARAAQENVKAINAIVAPSGRALAAQMDKDIYSVADATITGSAGDVGLDLSDMTSATLADSVMGALLVAGENLDKKDAPREGRFLVASPRTYRALTLTGQFMSAGQFGEGALVDGAVGRVAGFDIVPSNNLTNQAQSVSGTSKLGDHGLYGVRGSIAAAVRLAGEPEYVRLPDYFADGVRMLTLYGSKVIQPEGIGRFISRTEA